MNGALNRVVARLCRGARSLERALLVQHCMLCTAPSGDQPVCAPCTSGLEQLPPHCPCCAMPSPAGSVCGTCSTSAPWFDRTVAAWPYRFPLDRLVQALKFHARLQLAPWFASHLAERLPPFDVVMGLPLHRRRLAERGFNQAHEIARRIAPLRGVQVLSSGFERHRATGEQSHMPHDARAANVRGAFACTLRLHGVRVAVVDDVMTTGATLNEFAATLKRAGAAQVINCVVARTLF
jgi:ComF family protein